MLVMDVYLHRKLNPSLENCFENSFVRVRCIVGLMDSQCCTEGHFFDSGSIHAWSQQHRPS